MKARLAIFALAAACGMCLANTAHAATGISFDIANVVGAKILFTGTGSGPGQGADITFPNGVGGYDFQITNVANGTAGTPALGLSGNMGQPYQIVCSEIVTTGANQDATLHGNNPFTINDGAGNLLTGDFAGGTIRSTGTGGVINVDGTLNLSTVTYAGANTDLIAFRDQVNSSGGIGVLTFQFTSAFNLTSLCAAGTTRSTSYSGSLSAVTPEPSSMAIAGLGALGLIGYGIRRRRGA